MTKLLLPFVALLAAVCLFPAVDAQTTGSANFTYTFSGGFNFCSQCGSVGQYACSPDANGQIIGKWNDGEIDFMDPVPVGVVVHKMTVTLYGTWSCNPSGNNALFGYELNGVVHGVREATKGTNKCQCNTCDAEETFAVDYRNGMPGYKYNQYNTLKLVMYENSICLNRAFVSLEYVSGGSELDTSAFSPQFSNGLYDCAICGTKKKHWCSQSSNNTLSMEFNDPLPTGATAVGFDVYFSYNFVQKSYSGYYSYVYSSIDGTAITNVRYPDSSFRSYCGCYGEANHNSVFYQRGWPSYVYKGTNTLQLRVAKTYETYANMCFGRVLVSAMYYFFDENGQKVFDSISFEPVVAN